MEIVDLIIKKITYGFHTLVLWLFIAFLVCYGIPACISLCVTLLALYILLFIFFELPYKLFSRKKPVPTAYFIIKRNNNLLN